MNTLLDNIKTVFPTAEVWTQRKGLYPMSIPKEQLVTLVTHLKEVEGYLHLVQLTAVDWIEKNQFQLTYILNNPNKRIDVMVKTFIPRDNPTMETIHHLWEQAATYQRELREMFGIDFPGSPRVDKPFILEGWDNIPPYRRDFDTKKYAEETYFPRPGRETHDPKEYMKKKLYPDEI